MFEAMILVCFLDKSCIEATNNRGLLETEMACKARAAEMMSEFISAPPTPPVISVHFICQQAKGKKI